LDHGECETNELNQAIHNLLQQMQLLESGILNKSETITIATKSFDSYHNAILNHITEVDVI